MVVVVVVVEAVVDGGSGTGFLLVCSLEGVGTAAFAACNLAVGQSVLL